MYLGTHFNNQYRLEGSDFHQRTRQMTQLFTLFTDTQAVYFLHSTMSSVTCLQLSDASVIFRVMYFQFQIQSAFLACR